VCDLVILPGTKATIADLAFFRAQGWDIDLLAHARRGGKILGVCGGYQMLGRTISDPLGMEGPPGSVAGLGLLDVATELTGEKILRACAGVSVPEGAAFAGYEMHVGETRGADCARPLLRFDDGRADGAMSSNGAIRACYVHGLFGHEAQRAEILNWIGAKTSALAYEAEIDRVLDALAAHLESHIDLDALLKLAH
jgi:adenosylcobyric acid synthase